MYEFVRFYVCSFELQFLMPYEDSDNPNSIFYVFGVYICFEAIFGVSFLGGSGVSIKGVKIVRDTLRENNIQGLYSRTPQSNPENILKVYLPLSKHQLVINQ